MEKNSMPTSLPGHSQGTIFLVGWSDRFLMEAAKHLVESGAPVSHITLLAGEGYKSLPGPYRPFFEERGVALLDEAAYYHVDAILSLPRDRGNPPSAEFLRSLSACENDFLAVTDRLSFGPLSNTLRRRLYYLLVHHWLGFLQESRIRSLVFSSTPHMGWDLVLWHLAIRLGLEVRFFNRTLIPERVLFHRHIESDEKVPEGFLAGLDAGMVAERVGEQLLKDAKADSVWAQYSRSMNDRMKDGVRIEWKRLAWMALRFRSALVNSSFFFDRSIRTQGWLIPAYLRFWRHQKALHRLYHGLSAAPDYAAKYAFFALHFQPERSTMPEGGVFADQILALEILSAALPPGWLLYVKEHPRQFSLRFQSRHGRSEIFYRQLAAIPNVRLIATGEDSGKLARHSAFVATVTGSIGWEAIQMGKASIAFGNPWYAMCRSCHLVRSLQGCREAVADILAKPPEAVELDRLRFLAYLRNRLVHSSTSHEMASKSKASYSGLARNLADAIAREAGFPGPGRESRSEKESAGISAAQ